MDSTNQHISYLEENLKKADCDHYEIYLSQSDSTSIEVKEQQIDCFTTAQTMAVSLRILKDSRMGFSYSTDFTPESLNQIILNALISAENSSPDVLNGFPDQSVEFPDLDLLDSDYNTIPKESKIERLKQIERDAFSLDKRITKVRKAAYYEHESSRQLINSHGLNLSHRDTLFTTSIVVVAEESDDSQVGWDFDFSRFYGDLDTDTIGSSASSMALSLLGAHPVPSFCGPVVLDSSVGYQVLGVLAQSFLAESAQKNKSLLQGKMHKKIFSDQLSIIDDGLYPGGMATAPFDGEGALKQSTPLVEQGVLVNFLYDTYSGKKDKTNSTGNSSRGSSKSPPHPACSNLYIQKGNVSLNDMLSIVDKGLFVNEVMGIHTANPISGDFSLGVNGFLIEGGQKTSPVKGMALAGNIVSLFKNITAIGSDLRFYGKIGSPSLMIEAMDISGS